MRAADADDAGAEALPLVDGDERSHAGRPQAGESEPRPADDRAAGGRAARVVGAADVEAADHAPRAAADRASRLQPLAGREGELGALLDAWELARAGGGGVVVLEGEGGIGKTRIALELLARAERSGASTAACAALELGGAAPFGLWAELLGELARTLAPARPPPDAVWPEDLGRLSPAVAQRVRAAGANAPSASRRRRPSSSAPGCSRRSWRCSPGPRASDRSCC